MKRILWLIVFAMGLGACAAPTTAATTPSSANPTAVRTGSLDLSGVSFEVHQEPG